jgi:hypothetical protein
MLHMAQMASNPGKNTVFVFAPSEVHTHLLKHEYPPKKLNNVVF